MEVIMELNIGNFADVNSYIYYIFMTMMVDDRVESLCLDSVEDRQTLFDILLDSIAQAEREVVNHDK